MAHILVVDDHGPTVLALRDVLSHRGYRVTTAQTGAAMFEALTKSGIDLVLLDVMLPGDSGFSLCRRLRETSAVPVIFLTAISEQQMKINGLDLGGDDYLVKPFDPRELLARIEAVLRRTDPGVSDFDDDDVATFGFRGWVVDPQDRTLTNSRGCIVQLSCSAFELLLTFVRNPGRALSRSQLRDHGHGVKGRSLDILVSRLRKALGEEQGQQTVIETVRGHGYLFVPEVLRPGPRKG